jgi:hypothetical protein
MDFGSWPSLCLGIADPTAVGRLPAFFLTLAGDVGIKTSK